MQESDNREENFESSSRKRSADKRQIRNEKLLLKSLIRYSKVGQYIVSVKNLLHDSLENVALKKDKDNNFVMDSYSPLDILKLFNGLEIHNLHRAFSKFSDGISLEAFLILSFRILDIRKHDAPYALYGLVSLYESLTTKRGKKSLHFQDFLNNFIKMQSLVTDSKAVIEDVNVRFSSLSIQDVVHHDQPIKTCYFSNRLKLLFSLDEVSEYIRIYNHEAELKSKLVPKKENHVQGLFLISDFAWAENIRVIGVCFQDAKISFFHYDEKFSKEHAYSVTRFQIKIWYVAFLRKWLTCDHFNKLSAWNDTHKVLEEVIDIGCKITDLIEIVPLKVIAVATYDREIVLIDLNKKAKFLIIPLNESSAHTIRYSERQNLLFAATFQSTVRIFSIDSSKDYTKVGKLEHANTVAALELFDNDNFLITCDESGNIKAWDTRSLKNVQHSSMNTLHKANKIIGMRSAGRFSVITNRLNFFAFETGKTHSEKIDQIVPNLRFNVENDEMIIALINDIRIYNMKYGVLSEVFDQENFNISDKLVYVNRIKNNDKIFFSDYKGRIKQLTFSNDTNNQKPFRPYNADNSNIIFDSKYNILITWYKNSLKMYRYEDKNENILLRELDLPEKCSISQVKLCRSRAVLATVINYSYIIFWEYHKLMARGIYFANPQEFEGLGQSEILVNERSMTRKVTTVKKLQEMHSINSIKSRSTLFIPNEGTGRHSFNTDKPLEIPELLLSPKDRESDREPLDQLQSEIVDMLFVERYNCFIIIDGRYDIYLIEHKNFEEFKSRTKLEISTKLKSPDYLYIKSILKTVHLEPFLQENALKQEEVEHLVSNDEEKNHKGVQDQYLMTICDSEGRIISFNIKAVLHQHFKSEVEDHRTSQPYHTCNISVTDMQLEKMITKYKKFNQQFESKDAYELPYNKIKYWQAHDQPIIDIKLALFNSPRIVSLAQNCSVKVWSLSGELLGQLFVNDIKKTLWKVNSLNETQRIQVFHHIKSIVNQIFTQYESDIEIGKTNNSGFDNEDESQNITTEISLSNNTKSSKKNQKSIDYSSLDSEYIEYMLKRDKEEFGDAYYNKFYVDRQAPKATPDIKNRMPKEKDNEKEKYSTYTRKLAQKLEKLIEDGKYIPQSDDKKKVVPRVNLREIRQASSTPKRSIDEGLKKVKSEFFIRVLEKVKDNPSNKKLNQLAVQTNPTSSVRTVDYIEYFHGLSTPGTTTNSNFASTNTSKINGIINKNIGEINSVWEKMKRENERKGILRDLDYKMKSVKNHNRSTSLTQNLVDQSRSQLHSSFKVDNSLSASRSIQLNRSRLILNPLSKRDNYFLRASKDSSLSVESKDSLELNRDRSDHILTGGLESKQNSRKSSTLIFLKDNMPEELQINAPKKQRLPKLEYNSDLDREVTSNLDSLDKIFNQYGPKTTPAKLAPFNGLKHDVDVIRNSRKAMLSLEKYGIH